MNKATDKDYYGSDYVTFLILNGKCLSFNIFVLLTFAVWYENKLFT